MKEISAKWNDPKLSKDKYDRKALEEKERYDRELDNLQKEKEQEERFDFPSNGTYKQTDNLMDFSNLIQASIQGKPGDSNHMHTYRERRLSSVFQETGNGFSSSLFGHKHSIDIPDMANGIDHNLSSYLSIPSMLQSNNVVSPEPRLRQDSFYEDFMKQGQQSRDQPKSKPEFRNRSDSAFSDF